MRRKPTTPRRKNPVTSLGITPSKGSMKKSLISNNKKRKLKLTPAFNELTEYALKEKLDIKHPGRVMARLDIPRGTAKAMFVDLYLHIKKINGITITDAHKQKAENIAEKRIRNQYDPEIKAMRE